MRCLIIGVGRTGKSILKGLISIKEISKIYVLNRNVQSSGKVVEEIGNKKVEMFYEKYIPSVDYIIITLCAVSVKERILNIAKSKNTYEVRKKELKKNLLAIKNKISFLKKFPKKTRIVLMTNPVDHIENYLRKKLPRREIFGFGLRLDVNRYSRLLNKRIIAVGLHGKTIPLLNFSKEKDYDSLYNKVDKPFLKYIQKNGLPYKIYKNEFKKYFSKLISKKKNLIYTSYSLDDNFNEIKDVSVGLPFYIKNKKIIGIKKIKLNSVELKRLKKDVSNMKKGIERFK